MKKQLITCFTILLLFCGCAVKVENTINDPIEELKNHCKIVEEKDENIYFVEECKGFALEYAFINFNTSEILMAGETLNFKEISLNSYREQDDLSCMIYYDEKQKEIKSDHCSGLNEKLALTQSMAVILYNIHSGCEETSFLNLAYTGVEDFDFEILLPYIKELNDYISKNYDLDPSKNSDEYLKHMWRRYCGSEYHEQGKCVIH